MLRYKNSVIKLIIKQMNLKVGQTQLKTELVNWKTSQKKVFKIKHREKKREDIKLIIEIYKIS